MSVKSKKAVKKTTKRKNTKQDVEKEIDEIKEKIDLLQSRLDQVFDSTEEQHKTNVEKMTFQMAYLVDEIKKELNRDFVRKETFEPIKIFVYGLVGAIMLSVLAGILKLIHL